ncbi:MAG: DUF1957 domain-containing protein [Candidatus Omnitrophica bacterium]|nr:DUF1957 domain-containing protein [Candidatus Omnitrophota bacterium]
MRSEPTGYLSLVLHAHLPYVRHPEHEHFLEEDWLYEAITETYIPLLWVMERLCHDGIDYRLTMSLTPTLISMLKDDLLQQRYVRHIERLIELARLETERTRFEPTFQRLAHMYLHRFERARQTYVEQYGCDLVEGFRRQQDSGKLEIITCAATHGYLPNMLQRASVRAQISTGVQVYESALGRAPRGIWLPECGYNPGDEEVLKEFGIRYFFTDTHGIMFGSPRPKYGVYAPYYTRSGVAAFGRDTESSKSVWSAREGYPGDFYYRDFYRDVGFDLDYEYVSPYFNGAGDRHNLGIKYYRITGPTVHKEPYDSVAAISRAAEHAGNFMYNRQQQMSYLRGLMDRPPIVVAPYDAELFGHWWYEGPDWIDFLFRKMACDQKEVQLITPSEYLERYPKNQVMQPSMSSWGYKGYHEVWLEGSNDYIYRHLHKAVERMVEVAQEFPEASGVRERALNQMVRELLLAQSSDWAFILKTGTHTDYANGRVEQHIGRFNRLYSQVRDNAIDENALTEVESRDNLFPKADYRLYACAG